MYNMEKAYVLIGCELGAENEIVGKLLRLEKVINDVVGPTIEFPCKKKSIPKAVTTVPIDIIMNPVLMAQS